MKEKATFAAGCFWGVEAAFAQLDGVSDTRVGYCGGESTNPTYEEVCSGLTGHAEAVEIVFNPAEISFEDLVDHFFKIHDPTQLNRQGPDIGSQYRSVIFYHTEEQRVCAQQKIKHLETSGMFHKAIVTEIKEMRVFFPAEEYHQKYFLKHPGYTCHVI